MMMFFGQRRIEQERTIEKIGVWVRQFWLVVAFLAPQASNNFFLHGNGRDWQPLDLSILGASCATCSQLFSMMTSSMSRQLYASHNFCVRIEIGLLQATQPAVVYGSIFLPKNSCEK